MDDYINKEVVEIDKVIEENKNGAMRRVTTETHHSGKNTETLSHKHTHALGPPHPTDSK